MSIAALLVAALLVASVVVAVDAGWTLPLARAQTTSPGSTSLYVTSYATDEILRYHGGTGAFLGAFVSAGSGGLDRPHGMAFGPDGNLYVISADPNQPYWNVLRYNGATGAFIDVFVTDIGRDVTDMTFGPDGNLYITCWECYPFSSGFSQMTVERFNGTTGAFMGYFESGGGGLYFPTSLIFGPDGNLYVSTGENREVLRYNGFTGAFIDAFVSAGSGGLELAGGLSFGPDGNLYVSDLPWNLGPNNEVLRYNGFTGAFIDAFVSAGSGGLDSPIEITLGPDGNLYVISYATNEVLRYNGFTGAFIDAFVSAGSGGLGQPFELVFWPPDKDNGIIMIEKKLVGGGADDSFSFSKYTTDPSLPSIPPNFRILTESGIGSRTFTNLPAGGYVNITESDPSPFFMWTGLDCQSMRGDNLVSIHGPPGGSVGIRLDEDGDGVVKCTFTNTHVLFAAIDIKPGGSPNTINVKADKTVPVAILGSASLNIEKVDISPLSTDAPKFGGLTPQAPLKTSYEDVNKDGRTDLVLKYNTAGLGFTSSSTQGCVTGKLIDGTIITGCDSVKIINK